MNDDMLTDSLVEDLYRYSRDDYVDFWVRDALVEAAEEILRLRELLMASGPNTFLLSHKPYSIFIRWWCSCGHATREEHQAAKSSQQQTPELK